MYQKKKTHTLLYLVLNNHQASHLVTGTTNQAASYLCLPIHLQISERFLYPQEFDLSTYLAWKIPFLDLFYNIVKLISLEIFPIFSSLIDMHELNSHNQIFRFQKELLAFTQYMLLFALKFSPREFASGTPEKSSTI